MKKLVLFLTLAISVFTLGAAAEAASYTWDGGGDAIYFSDANNWDSGVLSSGAHALRINSGNPGYPMNLKQDIAGLSVDSVTFLNSGGNQYIKLLSSQTLEVNSLRFADDVLVWLNTGLRVGSDGTLNLVSYERGDAHINSNIDGAGGDIRITSQGDTIELNGDVTNASKIVARGNDGAVSFSSIFSTDSPTYIADSNRTTQINGNFSDLILQDGATAFTFRCMYSDDFRMQSGSTMRFYIRDSAHCAGYGRVDVTGKVVIGDGVKLSFSTNPGSIPLDSHLTIIRNDGTDAVSGRFAAKPEGHVFKVGGHYFSISYSGGTGNDVVLTAQ